VPGHGVQRKKWGDGFLGDRGGSKLSVAKETGRNRFSRDHKHVGSGGGRSRSLLGGTASLFVPVVPHTGGGKTSFRGFIFPGMGGVGDNSTLFEPFTMVD